ncbi:ribonuclease Z [Candidatus Woesearchaeota archaeon CG10_big_fil_rev_8_21_14_0_10_34_12]|nr:MAG: ribonuclease Z [Candidatus Woesearchaeota archaeon CG10_big_fil_rev_8_21_14_0_10_34_12]
MDIPIIFLGTGQAIPTARRNHTAILIQYKDENILVDCGEGTQRQFRKADINPCNLTRLLITHWHGDHILGIPGLLQTLALNSYNKTLYVYGPKGTAKFMGLMFRLFVFKEKIKIKVEEVEGVFLKTNDLVFEAVTMQHGAPCNAYSIKEKDKIRIEKDKLEKYKVPNNSQIARLKEGKSIKVDGKMIKAKEFTYVEKGRKIAIILDTRENPNCVRVAKNADVLICESTFLADSENGKKLAEDYKHLTAKSAATIARQARVKELILTHISQRYDTKEKLLLDEAKKIFKNVEIVEDLRAIKI